MGKRDAEAEVVEEGPRSFAVFAHDLADGHFNADASAELQALGRAIAQRIENGDAKIKGKLTIDLIFEADRGQMVRISYALKRKDPLRPTMPGATWLSDGGNFEMTNPRQGLLPGIHEVPRGESAREASGPKPREA